MGKSELAEIVERGMKVAGLTVDNKFVGKVTELSLGFPHYTHLLASKGALAAVRDGRTHVGIDDFAAAVADALEAASQTTRETYHSAVSSNRETLYAEVLLACARAKRDALGTFGAPDVRDQLRSITGATWKFPPLPTT